MYITISRSVFCVKTFRRRPTQKGTQASQPAMRLKDAQRVSLYKVLLHHNDLHLNVIYWPVSTSCR